ncbi:MAG: alkaline phosphatase family protein, partial [Acidobacteriales bacterium]|nr:alkaline phosphatase family protein [Terriglobales bacterium]
FTGHDDGKGHALAVALPDDVLQAIVAAGLANKTPDRSNDCGKTDSCNNGYSGDNTHPGTTSANITQQNYFANAVTKAILPKFTQDGRPFVLVFWSRDPDGTQHNQGDSLHQLTPGINGPTSRKALANADADLKQIVDFINADPKLRNNTDIFITSDHGFATISRHEVNRAMAPTQSYSATFSYKNSDGQLEIPSGSLPNGFLAIDLAHALKLNLFDPDQVLSVADGKNVYRRVDPTGTIPEAVQHPQRGDGLLGEKVEMPDGSDASVIVAANGGSDLIYLPDHDRDRAQAIVEFLSSQDYVGGIFVDYSRYGPMAGALDLTDVSLAGSARLPRPAMAVAFKKFNLQPGDRQTAAQIADTVLQEGQGMHGGLGRDSTFNNMAVIGPDFKQRYTDASPVGNADIAPTVARILGFELPANGRLTGRVAAEALRIGPHATAYSKKVASSPAVHGRRTLLHYQQVGSERYLDEACFLEQSKVACEP